MNYNATKPNYSNNYDGIKYNAGAKKINRRLRPQVVILLFNPKTAYLPVQSLNPGIIVVHIDREVTFTIIFPVLVDDFFRLFLAVDI